MWDLNRRAPLQTLAVPVPDLVEFSPSGDLLAVSSQTDGNVRLWAWKTNGVRHVLRGRSLSLRFTPDGSRLASGGRDGLIRLWDVLSGENLLTWHSKGASPRLHFARDGSLVVTSLQRQVRLWRARASDDDD